MKLEPNKTALLTLDFQKGILGRAPAQMRPSHLRPKRLNLRERSSFRLFMSALDLQRAIPRFLIIATLDLRG
jgi:hypothetical protein